MRNSAYPLCITTLVLAAFGGFFRWLQNQVSFDLDTGLAVAGSMWPYVTAAWFVIAAIILLVQSRRAINRDRVRRPETFAQAFHPVGGYTGVLVLICGLLMAAGGALLFFLRAHSETEFFIFQPVNKCNVVRLLQKPALAGPVVFHKLVNQHPEAVPGCPGAEAHSAGRFSFSVTAVYVD